MADFYTLLFAYVAINSYLCNVILQPLEVTKFPLRGKRKQTLQPPLGGEGHSPSGRQ